EREGETEDGCCSSRNRPVSESRVCQAPDLRPRAEGPPLSPPLHPSLRLPNHRRPNPGRKAITRDPRHRRTDHRLLRKANRSEASAAPEEAPDAPKTKGTTAFITPRCAKITIGR